MSFVSQVLSASFLPKVSEIPHTGIFELAYLASGADGDLGDKEVDCLRDLAAALGIKDLDAAVKAADAALRKEAYDERVRTVAKTITDAGARSVTYAALVALHVADLNAAPDEAALEELIEEEWGFEEQATELRSQVMALLAVPE
jgi:hypothetical protein